MFFLISFLWLLPSTFLFFLAILSPNWLTYTKTGSSSDITVQRGIFRICYVLSSNDTHETTECVTMVDQRSSTEPGRWIYGFAMGCASMAIICIVLSFLVLFLSGIYLQVRRRTDKRLWFLISMCLLLFIILGTSFSCWIILMAETLGLGITTDRRHYNWPTWIAIIATIGYLVSFIAMFCSFCIICRRNNKMEMHVSRSRDKF